MSDYVATSSFEDLPLSEELRKGIAERGYTQPTPVQAAVFAPVMAGRDMICRSKTGTGKTAAFGIPLLERIPAGARKASALVLCNTRELAIQVAQEIEALGKYKDLRVIAIYGGAGMGTQTEALHEGAEVIVGTPGRVYDHIRRGNLKLDQTRMVVLDEADEMLSAGFYEEVTRILDHLPSDRQTLLFSATVPPDIEQLAQKYLRDPETILLSGDVFTVEHIHNVLYHLVDQYPKPRNLLYLIEREDPDSAIIFCNLRTDTELVANVLNRNGLDAEMLNGDLPQKERERVMAKVKRGEVRFMVATDIAARGIDISDLSHVLNYSLPEDPAVYLHRVGRTGRIGKKGTAISLVSGAELNTLGVLEKKYGIQFEVRKLPTPDEAKGLWTGKHVRELQDAMQTGSAFEAFLPLAQELMQRDDGRVLFAYALKYFFTHHRMEKAQLRAAGERLLESHQVEKVQKEQKQARHKRDRGQRKPRLEGAPGHEERSHAERPAAARPEAPSDRVKLYVEQGADAGWTADALLAALSDAAGQPRETALAADVKPRYSYVLVRPDAADAYVALNGKPLKDKPARIEVARPRKR
ncbi:MAG TPA: DEAD/DEAH box helicase [Myxococcales bacterium]